MADSTAPEHTHAHHHHHHDGGRAEANRQHFDSQAHAQGYDANPMSQILAKKGGAAILKAFPFDEEKTVVLDYACGTGLLSQTLAPHTRTLIGVDISSKSVDYYNERVANQGIPADEMRAICAELKERGTTDPDPLDGIEFDVVVCTNAYHHFDDINTVTKILASYLKPGSGTLLVIDLIRSPVSESLHKDHGHVVAHKGGFAEEDIRNAFIQAGGLENFSFEVAFEMSNNSKSVDLFIAKGVRRSA
ncbi:methyltransferase domain protein [Ceratobasidium sp. AG-Ba]|nr:methyltransferase domain protein [Ceratobasidium sp. AG-Ba]QRW15350.1 methyltransferase domain protein [Ceratobasidium sp. AG-Ba]